MVVVLREVYRQAPFAAGGQLPKVLVGSVDDDGVFLGRPSELGVVDCAWLEAVRWSGDVVQ